MELVSTGQLAPAACIGAMLIETNCAFCAHDCNCLEFGDYFHGRCPIEFWLLGIVVLILHEHNCHAVMPWSFRLIVMVVKV